jgi:adenine-specific DNA-methyltransferase
MMTTGVNGYERIGPDAITAARAHRDPHPLPADVAGVMLEYPNKLPEREILAPIDASYVAVDQNGNLDHRDLITPNAVVLSDNFFVLHSLIQQRLKATLIYLDPPFCTGMEFQSRRLQHAYTDKLGQAPYLEFMRRRLVLLREVMADDGSIYLHIGHQMVGHLKALMDEVFGGRNFRNLITRRKCSSKNFTSRQYANIHDYILFYTRSSNYRWNQPGEKPDGSWIEREYPKTDSRGRYKLVPVHAPGTRGGETGKPWRGKNPPPGKHWQYQPSKLDELDKRGEIHWSRSENPRRKVYLEAEKLLPLTDCWSKFRDAHHQSVRITGYPTEKNLDMLKVIVSASSDPGDLVIDPFCGSGTTLEAADMGQRAWIGIDESFAALKATLGRLRHGTKAMGDYVNREVRKRSDSALPLFPANKELSPQTRVSGLPRPEFAFLVDADLVQEYHEEIRGIAAV